MYISKEEREGEVEVKLTEISFKDILPLWNKLWPERDTIDPMSSMTYLVGYDLSIYDKYEPTFFGIYVGGELIACNSGHQTGEREYRSRGLYVEPWQRRKGFAEALLLATCDRARELDCTMIWTCPRQGSQHAYYKLGFKRTTEWSNENMLYGPNCYAMREL